MKDYMDKNKNIILFVFDILDIYHMDSYTIVIRPRKKAFENTYHVEIGENCVIFLKKVASRKKQLKLIN